MDVGPQFQQQQLAGLGGGEARPIARVENPADGPRHPTFTPGRRGEQLKMFMTPSEIHAQYQPLDADRYERASEGYETGTEPSTPSSAGSEWGSYAGREYGGQKTHGVDSSGNWFQRTPGGHKWTSRERTESTEELYARKLDEAQGYGDEDDGYVPKMVGTPSHWTGGSEHYHGGKTATSELSSRAKHERAWVEPTPGGGWGSYATADTEKYVPSTEMTLHEAIGEQGVTHPIRLGTELGSEGKPQIVGGHHRLASATEHAHWGTWSHQFVPVLHHKNIGEARSGPTTAAWKYT